MQAIADSAALVGAYLRERAGLVRQLENVDLSPEGRTRLESRVRGVDAALAGLGHVAAPQQGPQRTAEDTAPKRAARRNTKA